MARLRQHLTTRRRALAALAALPLAIVTAAAATVAPASAASMTAQFKIDITSAAYQYADVRAVIPLGQYEVWGYLNNGAHAHVQLFGDDPAWDDLLWTTSWAYLGRPVQGVSITGTSEGIVVTWRQPFDNTMYDEDVTENRDELYVKVMVIDGDGHLLAQANSNVVYHYSVY